jgi:aquaporin Z
MRAPSEAFRNHWLEYLSEAAGLGLFMVSAVLVTTVLEYPKSFFHDLVQDVFSGGS